MIRRLLVLGETGQVARELARTGAARGVDVVAVGRATADLLATNPLQLLEQHRPDTVVNAAAYTAVDRAEQEEGAAFLLNAELPGRFARACAGRDLPFVHLSTDYVFDGEKSSPYVEDDVRRPMSAYGRSKAAGEDAVAAAAGAYAVLRTSWVFSPFGTNFVKTMLRLAKTESEVAVVADQVGRPTPAKDVAEAALRLADALSSSESRARGVFHVTGEGDATWADLARATFDAASSRGARAIQVRPISTAERPTEARRPQNSRLGGERLWAATGWSPSSWRSGLEQCVAELLEGHAPSADPASAPVRLASGGSSL